MARSWSHTMIRKRAQVMYVCMYLCMDVCMFFEDFSRLRALTEPKVVSYGRVVDNTLLRYV